MGLSASEALRTPPAMLGAALAALAGRLLQVVSVALRGEVHQPVVVTVSDVVALGRDLLAASPLQGPSEDDLRAAPAVVLEALLPELLPVGWKRLSPCGAFPCQGCLLVRAPAS